MITILDVAKEANVSAATVSRVLNNTGNVRPETVELVYAAAEKLGYEPNMLARSLRRGETRTILIILPNITNPYYAHIISGINETISAQGYSCFICNTMGVKNRSREFLDMLHKRRADGAIMLAMEPEQNKLLLEFAGQYPLVQCSEFDPRVPIPHVSIDNYRAAREAVEYLISLGHQRIGTVSSENKYLSTRLRLKGYQDALTAAGIAPKEQYVHRASVDYNFQSGKRAAKLLLSQETRPTALFCISDVLALGAISGAQEMGFSVPEDVTVIGFDDVEQTTIFKPNITTVAQPCYEIGRHGAELLLKCLELPEGQQPLQMEVILPHKLIVRESAAAQDVLDFPVD